MRSEKENGHKSGAGAPWLHDPPKEQVHAQGNGELEEELNQLAKSVAEEVKKGEVEKKPAELIAAGGLDEAKAYVAPMAPATQAEHQTLEMEKVRVAKDVDPRHAVTQKVDRATAAKVAARKDGAESPWSQGSGAGIDKALLPSSYGPKLVEESPAGALGEAESSRARSRTLERIVIGGAILAVVLMASMFVLVVRRDGTQVDVEATEAATPRESAPVGPPVTPPGAGAAVQPDRSGVPAAPGAQASSGAAASAPLEASVPPSPSMASPPRSPSGGSTGVPTASTGVLAAKAAPSVVRPPATGRPGKASGKPGTPELSE